MTGKIQLQSNILRIEDRAQISANADGEGRSLGMSFEIEELIISDGAQILAITNSTGQGGDIRIQANNITIEGTTADGNFPSLISTQTRDRSSETSADSGTLTIDVERLTLSNGGAISSDTFGVGNAGQLSVTANEVTVRGQAEIASIQLGLVEGTDISRSPIINDDGRLPSRITAFTAGLGNGGNANITADRLTVRDGGRIEVGATALETTGDAELVGNSGNLNLQLDRLHLDGGEIRADTINGNFGNITIDTNNLWLDRRSRISTNATGQSSGGNIAIDTENLVAFENSDITATAQNSTGGRIDLSAIGIFGATQLEVDDNIAQNSLLIEDLTSNNTTSDITASSALGSEFSGTVTIDTPDIAVDRGLIEIRLPSDPPLLQNACDTPSGDDASRFSVVGRGGLPGGAEQIAELTDLFPEQPHETAPQQLSEARYMQRDWNNDIVLSARYVPLTPPCSLSQ